jgi:hypothetical protein
VDNTATYVHLYSRWFGFLFSHVIRHRLVPTECRFRLIELTSMLHFCFRIPLGSHTVVFSYPTITNFSRIDPSRGMVSVGQTLATKRHIESGTLSNDVFYTLLIV